MNFMAEIFINKKVYLELKISQLKCFGYNIITKCKVTSKGEKEKG